jgi:hypothetical protein
MHGKVIDDSIAGQPLTLRGNTDLDDRVFLGIKD